MMKSLSLFSIPVGLCNFGKSNHELNVSIIDDIFTERDEDKQGTVNSNMGGWHSSTGLEKKYKSFATLCSQIEKQANLYCTEHGYQDGLYCKSLWANINETGDMNMPHHHGNACLTGVYYPVQYVDENEENCFFNYNPDATLHPGSWNGKDGGSVVFFDPSYGYKTKLKKTNKPTQFNMTTWCTYPVSGLLVLFPSYLLHEVTPFKEIQKRLSISFVCNYK